MRITDVTARLLSIPYPQPFKSSWTPGVETPHMMALVVKIKTDSGITGVAGSSGAFGGEVFLETLRDIIRPMLLGTDVFATEHIANRLRYVSEYYHPRPWVVGIAVWDAIGKAAGQPLYKLWGGFSDRLPAYASLGEVRSPEQRVDDVLALRAYGFRAVKLRIHSGTIEEDIAQIAAVRSAVGDSMAIMVDANQANSRTRYAPDGSRLVWSYERALETARALADYGVKWLEEPLPRHDYDQIARLTKESPIPIAGGEGNMGMYQLRHLLKAGCYHILQPDCTLSEEIFQLRKFASLVEMEGKQFIPHTWATGLGLVANLHLCAALPNGGIVEFPHDPPVIVPDTFQGMMQERVLIDSDGYIPVPTGPGLGVNLDEDAINRYTVKRV